MNILFLLLTIISLLGAPIFLILALFNLIRKKPAKKRFKWAGISALVFISSLVGFGFTMEPPAIPESIELSIPDYQAEYDINTEIPLSITVFPEHADTSSLEYIASGDTLTFSESSVNTGSAEGSFDVYVKSGDNTSNTLSINVIDVNAREKALELAAAEEEKQRALEEAEQKRIEAEKAAAEAEQKRLEEEKAAKEAEQKRLAEEKAAQEAEQKRLEEEKAAQESEQKRLEEEKAAQEIEQKRLAEEKAAQEAEQQTTPQQAQVTQESNSQSNTAPTQNGSNFNTYDNAAQQETSASYVLNTNTHKIHYPSCKSVKKIAPQNYSTSNSSVEELISQGYKTCGNCF